MMRDWFLDAKLGIFIHWGIYSVDGVAESWSFFNGDVTEAAYFAQCAGFTASQYDPDEWAGLFVRAGARYAVLTARHHDGIALWDSRANPNTVVRRTPAGRDLIRPYIEAMRRRGLKIGLYYSHLDWTHPDYATLLPTDNSHITSEYDPHGYAFAREGQESRERWASFLRFHRAELRELSTEYGPIDLFWFDGEWERSAEDYDMAGLRRELQARQPDAIFNGRLTGHGDFATPEQGMPITPPEGPWELCVTINDSWGYQPRDTHWKSPARLVRIFAETIGMGGNLLLDVGPREDGTIPEEASERLLAFGAWIARHSDAVYGTRAGLPPGLFHGASTSSPDRRRLFLIQFDVPREGIAVKGLRTKPRRARLLSGPDLSVESVGGHEVAPPVRWIALPAEACDPLATVVELEFDSPYEIYLGAGRQ